MKNQTKSQAPPQKNRETSITEDRMTLVSRIKKRWRTEEPDANRAIQSHPHLQNDRPVTLSLAYEEFCHKREQGQSITVSSFCERYPHIYRSLYRQLEVEEFLRAGHVNVGPQKPTWPEIGDALFEFVIAEELGHGAFARAYLCSQVGIGDRHVVVKYALDGAFEANTMGRLTHPNIMPVFSVREDTRTGASGICMPFVGRSTLLDVLDVAFVDGTTPLAGDVIAQAAKISSYPMDRYYAITPPRKPLAGMTYIEAVIDLGIQLADALEHAHEHGIIHGDMKPSNVVMTVDGCPMIVDFNLSRDDNHLAIIAGGTLPYMAPEQITAILIEGDVSQEKITARCDIYSLGVVIFELLTGRLPYAIPEHTDEQESLAQISYDDRRQKPKNLQSLNPQVPSDVAAAIYRSMRFKPSDRYSSIREFKQELESCLSRVAQKRRWKQSRRMLVTTGLVGLLPISLTAAWMINREPEEIRLVKQAVDSIKSEQYSSAIGTLNRLIKNHPQNKNARFIRAQACAIHIDETDDFDLMQTALKDLESLLYESHRVAALQWQAFCYFLNEDFSLAESNYRQLIHDGIQDARTYNNLGQCHFQLAKEQLRRIVLLRADKERRPILLENAQKHFRRAHELFAKSIALDELLFEPHYNLGDLYLDKSYGLVTLEEAYSAVAQAVAIREESASACGDAALIACDVWRNSRSNHNKAHVINYLNKAKVAGFDVSRFYTWNHFKGFRDESTAEYFETDSAVPLREPRGIARPLFDDLGM